MKTQVFIWIFLGLVELSEQFMAPATYYEISKREGDAVELKCEPNVSIDHLMWKKKDTASNRWNVIYQGGFRKSWGEIFSLATSNLISYNITSSLSSIYTCVDINKGRVVSNITLTVLDRCVHSANCPTVEVHQCSCPTLPTITTTTSETTLFPGELKEVTDNPMTAKDLKVECDEKCLNHESLFCHRDDWKLRCSAAQLKCNDSEIQAEPSIEPSTMKDHEWLKILHLSLHGFMLLVIISLLIYICHLRKIIGRLTSSKQYEIPMLQKEEEEYNHKYASSANTYDIIADARLKEYDYDKYLKLQTVKNSDLPPIPDYLEVIT